MIRLKASIIVPTYKRFEMFVKCVQSLIEQDFDPNEFEIIAVHDGLDHDYNMEEIGQLITAFPNLRFLTIAKSGVSEVRNHAIRMSRGQYVLMIDDDCMAVKNWIATMVDYLDTHREVVAVGGQVLAVPPKTFIERYIKDKNLLRRPVKDVNGNIVTLITANVAYRHIVLKRLGGFSPHFMHNKSQLGGEDLDLAFRATQFGALAYCEQAVTHHHHRSTLSALTKQHFQYGRGVYIACVVNKIDYRRVKFSRPTIFNLFRHAAVSFFRLFSVSVPEFWTKRIPLWKWPAYFCLDLVRRNVFMIGAVYEFYRQGGDDHAVR